MSWLFASSGQSIGASASASVLPMNIQDWFPLGLTGLISLQSKGLSRVFSSITVWKHQFRYSAFFMVQHSPSVHDHWKNYNFDSLDLCRHLRNSNFPPSVKPGFPQAHRMALHIMAHGSYGCPSWRRRPGGRAGRAGHLSMICLLILKWIANTVPRPRRLWSPAWTLASSLLPPLGLPLSPAQPSSP